MSDLETLREMRVELQALALSMQDVSSDGRRLASDLAMSIMEIVAIQCNAVDERLAVVLRRLEEIERRAA
jgi:hypothetical protein